MMTMDQVFRALPRDLQWEVLAEFVGSHAVRKGKLRRKLVLDSKYRAIMKMPRIQQVANPYNLECLRAAAVVILSNERKITFYEGPHGYDIRYQFRNPNKYSGLWDYERRIKTIYPTENSVALPLFEKHSYLSYEYTDKKKKKTLMR